MIERGRKLSQNLAQMLLDILDDGIGSLLDLHALGEGVGLEMGDDALGDGDDLLGFFGRPH